MKKVDLDQFMQQMKLKMNFLCIDNLHHDVKDLTFSFNFTVKIQGLCVRQ